MFFLKCSKKVAPTQLVVQEPVFCPEDRDAINEYFDRSAGRYCGYCQQHGSHHTDAHQSFALNARLRKSGLRPV